MKDGCRLAIFLAAVLAGACPPAGGQAPDLSGVPAPGTDVRVKSAEELRLEDVIDAAYRRCFRFFRIGEVRLELRIPFGQNGEREGATGFTQRIFRGGKAGPEAIWEQAALLFRSADFTAYLEGLREDGDRVVSFDLERQSVAVYRDSGLFQALAEGPYPGTRVRVYLLKTSREIAPGDLYDYLYCVGSLGMDCSGFITYIQRSVAAAYQADLNALLAAESGLPESQPTRSLGLRFYRPEAGHAERVEDRIENLRPGDVILFRGRSLSFRHSAVIQSADPAGGVIRYLQCTDWAPRAERGVHESFITFDPDYPERRLGAESCVWTQSLAPAFPGEPGLRYWRNDGDRYRSYQAAGGSIVVRLKALKRCIEAVEPGFF
jgi:hypothetical protein